MAAVRYLLVTETGELTDRTATDWRTALDTVGPEGWDKARLATDAAMGYVNDCGLLAPDKYQRNPVGAAMLVLLGANAQPYAGPVVLTGWDDYNPDEVEVCSLSDDQVAVLRQLHSDVRRALGLDDGTPETLSAESAEQVRGYAAWLATAPTPGWTVHTGDDALAYLRGRTGGGS